MCLDVKKELLAFRDVLIFTEGFILTKQNIKSRLADKHACYIIVYYLSYVYSKQPILGLTQEWLREVWSPRQGICLFTPCVGSFTSPGVDTR